MCSHTRGVVPGASCPGRRGGGRAERPLRPEGTGAAVCGPALAELPPDRWPGPPQCRELSRPLRGCGWRASPGPPGSELLPVSGLRPPHPEQPALPKRSSYPCGRPRGPAPPRPDLAGASHHKPSKARAPLGTGRLMPVTQNKSVCETYRPGSHCDQGGVKSRDSAGS